MKKVLRKILIVFCIIIICCSSAILGYRVYYIFKDKMNTDSYQRLVRQVADDFPDSKGESEKSLVLDYSLADSKSTISDLGLSKLSSDTSNMAKNFCKFLIRKLREKYENEDIIGYIKCINHDLEYPIVQGEVNDDYLHTGLDKNYDYNGSIFLDSGNTEDFMDSRSVVYGHNMRNGSMFGNLKNFYGDSIKDSYFLIYTEEGINVYKIICYATIYAYGENYYVHPEKEIKRKLIYGDGGNPDSITCSEEEAEKASSTDIGLEEFYEKIKKKAMKFDDKYVFSKGDKFLTLMTCFGDGKTERLAITGYLING